ncbi:DinB family protein [Streptomyces sp. NPDC048442]|uniref:DinB family protein n=1 Tax=Streptomyces sp. NPDC048442 TaxID=3154823 RepID=UPI0034435A34
MTTEQTDPKATARTNKPVAWDERSTLTNHLDYARRTAWEKCAGVSAEHAVAAPLPGSPLMSLWGLISHLRWVEHWWFDVIFLGNEDEGPWTDEDPDREMRVVDGVPIDAVIAEYAEKCVAWDALVARTDLDALAVRPLGDGRQPTMRWVLMHLVEEIARHNGHLDILRELADGTTGD